MYVWSVNEDFEDLEDAPEVDNWDQISYINRPLEIHKQGKPCSLVCCDDSANFECNDLCWFVRPFSYCITGYNKRRNMMIVRNDWCPWTVSLNIQWICKNQAYVNSSSTLTPRLFWALIIPWLTFLVSRQLK